MIDRGSVPGRDAFAEDWRVACPEGHVRLQPAASTATAYCASCNRSYDWDMLIDRKLEPADG